MLTSPEGDQIMTLTEMIREMDSGRLTREGFMWVITHMASDMPDRYREATMDLCKHITKYPDERSRFFRPIPQDDDVDWDTCPGCGGFSFNTRRGICVDCN